MGVFVAISVVAYPDNPAAHIVGDNGLWCIAISEHYQAIVIVLVGIVDGLLERGSAASDDCDSGNLVLDESLFRVKVV